MQVMAKKDEVKEYTFERFVEVVRPYMESCTIRVTPRGGKVLKQLGFAWPRKEDDKGIQIAVDARYVQVTFEAIEADGDLLFEDAT